MISVFAPFCVHLHSCLVVTHVVIQLQQYLMCTFISGQECTIQYTPTTDLYRCILTTQAKVNTHNSHTYNEYSKMFTFAKGKRSIFLSELV